MSYDNLIVINLALCLFIFWACVCRLKMTSRDILVRVRTRYIAIGTGALFGGFGHWLFPFFGGAYVGMVIFVVAVALAFWLDKQDWSRGPPDSAHSQPGGLDEPRK